MRPRSNRTLPRSQRIAGALGQNTGHFKAESCRSALPSQLVQAIEFLRPHRSGGRYQNPRRESAASQFAVVAGSDQMSTGIEQVDAGSIFDDGSNLGSHRCQENGGVLFGGRVIESVDAARSGNGWWVFAIFSTLFSIWCVQIKCVSAAFGKNRYNWGWRSAQFYPYFTIAYDFGRLPPIRNCSRILLPRLGSRVQIPFPAPIKSMGYSKFRDSLERNVSKFARGGAKFCLDITPWTTLNRLA